MDHFGFPAFVLAVFALLVALVAAAIRSDGLTDLTRRRLGHGETVRDLNTRLAKIERWIDEVDRPWSDEVSDDLVHLDARIKAMEQLCTSRALVADELIRRAERWIAETGEPMKDSFVEEIDQIDHRIRALEDGVLPMKTSTSAATVLQGREMLHAVSTAGGEMPVTYTDSVVVDLFSGGR